MSRRASPPTWSLLATISPGRHVAALTLSSNVAIRLPLPLCRSGVLLSGERGPRLCRDKVLGKSGLNLDPIIEVAGRPTVSTAKASKGRYFEDPTRVLPWANCENDRLYRVR